MEDIEWILTEDITAKKIYRVTSKDGAKTCDITFSPEGRMLFDGEDIETEDFMAYVGLLDGVDDGYTTFEGDIASHYLRGDKPNG